MSKENPLNNGPAITKNSEFVVATIIQVEAPTSGQIGDKAIICSDKIVEGWVGGGCVQPAVIKAANTVLQKGESQLIRVAPDGLWQPIDGVAEYTSHCLGGGSVLLFMEPHINNPTLHIFGDSSIAHNLALMSSQMNLNIVLIGGNMAVDSYASHIHHAEKINALHNDFIVIATQGKGDLSAINAALATGCRYIKMVVSSKKLAGLKAKLAAKDISADQIDRISGPAGLDINAKLPAEVAVSVLAEIIQTRRACQDSGLVIESSDPSIDVVEANAVTNSDNSINLESNAGSSAGGCCG